MTECSKIIYVTYYPSIIILCQPNKISSETPLCIFKFQGLILFKFFKDLLKNTELGSVMCLAMCLALGEKQGFGCDPCIQKHTVNSLSADGNHDLFKTGSSWPKPPLKV